jgi:hypothetical protein
MPAGPPASTVQPRSALALGLASAGLAIALAFELEARLDSREGDGWRTVSSSDEGFGFRSAPFSPGCAGREMRLQVDNDRLLASSVDVYLWYSDASGASVTLVQDTWRLARGETRVHEFTIPSEAFTGAPQGSKAFVQVNAEVDGLYLGACVEAA